MMKRLAVCISNKGSGTNLAAIIDAIKIGTFHAQIAVVISDTEDAKGVQLAKTYNLPVAICRKKEELLKIIRPPSRHSGKRSASRISSENSTLERSWTSQDDNNSYPVDFVCLAGWKQIITNEVIDAFPNRILNMHPGLIPDTITGIVKNPDGTNALWNKGKLTDFAIQNFLNQKATYAGSTLHFLTHEFDFGEVLGHCFEKIKPDDTISTLYSRLKKKENQLYVKVLRKLCN